MSGAPGGSASAEFWEPIYERRGPSDGIPSAVLAGVAAPLAAGSALDLGCGLGDNSIWLAGLGWRVTAVDVSPTAVERVAARAAALGLGAQVTAERHDLARSFPEGSFDLVLALYLESPIDFGRDRALRRAAEAVAAGGLLLVATHGSVSPWSWNQDPDTRFATPAESLAELQLEPGGWDVKISGALEREATGGPRMETATVIDVVTAVRRRALDGRRPRTRAELSHGREVRHARPGATSPGRGGPVQASVSAPWSSQWSSWAWWRRPSTR